MSRPPNHHQQLSSAYDGRNGLIDFVNVPVNSLSQSYSMEEMHPSIYAQAGFPGYSVPMGAQMGPQMGAQMGVVQHMPMQPAYHPSLGAAYHQVYPTPIAAPAFLSSEATSVESEAVLHARINDKIDEIIRTQKDSMLHSKIESLSNKVEQLSHNLASNDDTPHIHRLSDKVQQLSQSLDLANERRLQAQLDNMDRQPASFMHAPYTISEHPVSSQPVKIAGPVGSSLHADHSDAEISRRLRRLAAESSMRQRAVDSHRLSEKVPDW